MKLTEWYPANINPVRVGLYETQHYKYGKAMRFWDGFWWCSTDGRFICTQSVQHFSKWRGLKR
jgi:hypothetical protein